MVAVVTHSKVVDTPDDGTSPVGTNEWNAPHVITGLDNVAWTNARFAKAAAYAVLNADKGSTIALGGSAFYALTFGAASGYDANFSVMVTNEDVWGSGRAKWISLSGGTDFYLWPTESVVIFNSNNAWRKLGHRRAKAPLATITLNSDFTNGTDTIGATDGLGTGASAFKTALNAYVVGLGEFDFLAAGANNLVIALAPNTTDTTSIHLPAPALIGQQGNAGVTFKGAALAISGVANNGSGVCRIAVPSTATYSASQIVSVYGVVGPTAANGTWKVTVVDGTHLDLQGSTWPSITYVSGGTVTNGSVVSTTGAFDAVAGFGPVHAVRFRDFTVQSAALSGISIQGPGRFFIDDGMILGPCGTSHISADGGGSNITIAAPIGIGGIAAGQLFHTLTAHGGQILYENLPTINVVPSVGPAQAFAIFAYSVNQGGSDYRSAGTINLNGNTITGQRWRAENLGLVVSKSGVAPDTYFPGNSAGSQVGGGIGIQGL